jgi:hypothetical protein
MFMIVNKQAVRVPFILNSVQAKYSHLATARDIIVKARREGFSSYIKGEFLTACITEMNTRAVILSQDTEATQKHLGTIKYMIKHMQGAVPEIGYNSKNEITFPKMDSTIYIGTAGSREYGRGDTITHLHLSEPAFYADLKTLMAGVGEAAAHAKRVVLESTGNGFNNFQKLAYKSLKGLGSFKLHFYPWFDDVDNSLPLIEGELLSLTDEDLFRMETYHVSLNQMKWYVKKREDYMESPDDMEGKKLFEQEYPFSLEEAFISTGAKYFNKVVFIEQAPVRTEGKILIFKEPIPGYKYAIGVDYSGGIGQDYAVIQVIDIDNLEQVAVYRDCWTGPEDTSIIAARLGREYNDAFMVPEYNNHGRLGVDILKRIYPVYKIYKREIPANKSLVKMDNILGYLTTMASKPYGCSTLKLYLRRGLVIHHSDTHHELQAFEDMEGKLQAPTGEFDDCVMSLCLAAVGIRKLVEPKERVPEAETPPSIDFNQPIYPFKTLEEWGKFASGDKEALRIMGRFYNTGSQGYAGIR